VTVVQAHERPVRRQLAGLEGPLGVIADDERGAALAQQRVDRIGEPALVAELEAMPAGRHQLERGRDPLEGVALVAEVGRELPDEGPQLVRLDQRHDALVVAVDALLDLAQAPHVGEVAAGLGGKREPVGRLLHPAGDRVARGEPVEGRVHLDGVEQLGVPREPA